MLFISLGPSCHTAGNLNMLHLRTISLPFDWLMTNNNKGLKYVNDLINTGFNYFTKDLEYNYRDKVISKYYPDTEFFHYDLIKNITYNRDNNNNSNLIEMMNYRASRFMNIISDCNNNVTFLYLLHNRQFTNDSINLYNDMYNLDTNNNIRCKHKILVYIYDDDNNFELKIPDKFKNLKNFIFDKYIFNKIKSHIYGDIKDFEKLLKNNNLI